MELNFTKKQGQYLAFIYYYQKLNRKAPSHVDFEDYFKSYPASVNSMLITLEKKGYISKEKGKVRSIKLLLKKDQLPELE